MIEAAIFDMDGLLIDSEPFWRKSHIEILGKYGFVITEDDIRAAAGKRTEDQVEIWRQRFGWEPHQNTQVTQEIVDNVTELVHVNGTAMPGVYQMVEMFKAHNIPMAVASSSAQELIDVVLERLDLAKYMQFSHSGTNEKRGKPFPDVFLTTAKKLGVNAANCVVFEDSLNGTLAAEAAGMKCISVPEHPNDPAEFKMADLVVNSLEDVDWDAIQKLWEQK